MRARTAEGNAALSFQPERGGVYLVRVGQRLNSAPGAFRLEVGPPEPPPRPPGVALRGGVAQGSLDALQNERDAWSYSMRAGASYRLNVAARSCVTLLVYPPGTRDFARARPVRRSGCDGYLLFTPRAGEGGRHSLVVQAESGPSGEQRYRLQAAGAAADDTAPGLLLPNLSSVRGSLRGAEVDAVDLYRFTVDRRSALEVSLDYRGTGTVELAVLNDGGRQIGFGSDAEPLTLLTPGGRYYVAVRTRDDGAGRYTLRRVSRTITRTTVTIAGERAARVRPAQAVRVRADVAPGVAGRVGFTVERFDPLAGWQFFRQLRATIVSGSASVVFAAPSEGRWRVRAAFEGTRTAAPSESGYATLNAMTAAPH